VPLLPLCGPVKRRGPRAVSCAANHSLGTVSLAPLREFPGKSRAGSRETPLASAPADTTKRKAMSSGNQELDQQFDDDVMLQLALQMSLQAQPPQSPTAELAPHEAATDAAVKDGAAEPVAHAEAAEDAGVAEAGKASDAGAAPAPLPASAEPTMETPKKKKKAKKNRYKDLIAARMASPRTDEEVQREHREKLKASMGGGEFSKVEKI